MLFIFIVDSQGVAERVAHTAHMRINALRDLLYMFDDRLLELEGQAAATELAVRSMANRPQEPFAAAAEARDILRILEG